MVKNQPDLAHILVPGIVPYNIMAHFISHMIWAIWYDPYDMVYSLYQYSSVRFESVSKWVTMVNRIKSILRSHTQYVQLTLCHVRYYILYDLNLYIANIIWFLSDSNFMLYFISYTIYDIQYIVVRLSGLTVCKSQNEPMIVKMSDFTCIFILVRWQLFRNYKL